METKTIILLVIGIVLFILFYNLSTIWKFIKSKGNKSSKKSNSSSTPVSQAGNATHVKKKRNIFKIFGIILGIIVLIVILFWTLGFIIEVMGSIKNFFSNEVSNSRNVSIPLPPRSLPDSTKVCHDTIIEYYGLSQGEQKVIYTHPGYNYSRNSGGWKYYYKSPNDENFTIRGDGQRHIDSCDIPYFYVKFYEVECVITVVFVKKK